MKTRIATLITTLAIVLSTSGFTYAAVKTDTTATTLTDSSAITAIDSNVTPNTVLTDIGHINKIEANGNVKVYVINGDKEEVEVNDNYYGENALVQNEGGVLRITSFKTDTLVVWVTVKNLTAITANYNASIASLNKLSSIDMEINLNDTASADLDLDAIAANVKVSDNASVDLSGSVNELDLGHTPTSTVKIADLTATNKIEKVIADDVLFPTALNRLATM